MKPDVLSWDVPYSQPTDRWTIDALERLGAGSDPRESKLDGASSCSANEQAWIKP
jgi:hypothetical protein